MQGISIRGFKGSLYESGVANVIIHILCYLINANLTYFLSEQAVKTHQHTVSQLLFTVAILSYTGCSSLVSRVIAS